MDEVTLTRLQNLREKMTEVYKLANSITAADPSVHGVLNGILSVFPHWEHRLNLFITDELGRIYSPRRI